MRLVREKRNLGLSSLSDSILLCAVHTEGLLHVAHLLRHIKTKCQHVDVCSKYDT